MYESEHAVKIMQLGRQLQAEMARTYDPKIQVICQICQEIENSACAIYEWARGVENRQGESKVG